MSPKSKRRHCRNTDQGKSSCRPRGCGTVPAQIRLEAGVFPSIVFLERILTPSIIQRQERRPVQPTVQSQPLRKGGLPTPYLDSAVQRGWFPCPSRALEIDCVGPPIEPESSSAVSEAQKSHFCIFHFCDFPRDGLGYRKTTFEAGGSGSVSALKPQHRIPARPRRSQPRRPMGSSPRLAVDARRLTQATTGPQSPPPRPRLYRRHRCAGRPPPPSSRPASTDDQQ